MYCEYQLFGLQILSVAWKANPLMETLVSLLQWKLIKQIKVLLAFRSEGCIIFYEFEWFITFFLIYCFIIVYVL